MIYTLSMNQRIVIAILFGLIAIPLVAYAGTLTMTTYYPAPTGNYDLLKANSVGIGTVTTQDRLTVAGATTGYASFGDPGCAGNYTGLQLNGAPMTGCTNYSILGGDGHLHLNRSTGSSIFFKENNVPQMTILNGGRVGVGLMNPNTKFEVLTAAASDGISLTNGTRSLRFMAGTVAAQAFNDITQANDNAIIYSSGVQAQGRLVIAPSVNAGTLSGIRMDGNGNVGIGTVGSAYPLEVNGSIHTSAAKNEVAISTGNLASPSYDIAGINVGSLNIYGYSGICSGMQFGDCRGTGGVLIGGTNATVNTNIPRVGNTFFNNGNNVGIGNNNPMQMLDVTGSIQAAANNFIRIGSSYLSSSNPSGMNLSNNQWWDGTAWQTNGNAGMLLQFARQAARFYGDSAVGATNPSFFLVYNGPNTTAATLWGDLTVQGTSGNITANGFFYNPSDRRLKEHIRPINHAIDKVKALNGVTFHWKKDKSKGVGVISQDVEKIFPELIHTDKNGMKSVAYPNLIGLLVEATKEQQNQIDALKKEVAQLRKDIKR